MNRKAKYILIGTALLTATAAVQAFNGNPNCNQRGAMMRGDQGVPMFQGQGRMNRQGGMWRSPLRAAYQLDDLTPEQRYQLDAIRQAHQETRRQQQLDMDAHRNEVKKQLEDILTEQQQERLTANFAPNS